MGRPRIANSSGPHGLQGALSPVKSLIKKRPAAPPAWQTARLQQVHSPVRFADDLRDHKPDFVDPTKDYETADFTGLLGEMAALERDFNNLTMISSVWLGINSKRGVGGGGVRGSSSVNGRSGLYDNIEEVAEGELAASADDDDDPALAGAVDPIGLRTRLTGTLTQVYVHPTICSCLDRALANTLLADSMLYTYTAGQQRRCAAGPSQRLLCSDGSS
jgi:hypothetical protein